MNTKSQDKNLVEIQAQWVTVRGRIRQKIGDAQFKSWIKVLVFEDYDDHKVILSVSSNFVRTRIICLLYTSPSPRDISGSRMPSSA